MWAALDHTILFDEGVDSHHIFPEDGCKKQGIAKHTKCGWARLRRRDPGDNRQEAAPGSHLSSRSTRA